MNISANNAVAADVMLYFSVDPLRNRKHLIKFYDGFMKLGGGFDFCVIGFVASSDEKIIVHDVGGRKIKQYIFGVKSIEKLGYPIKGATKPFSLKPGNCDLPVLLYWLQNKTYRRYWVMEDDVEYSGDPLHLFASLQKMEADLLATHLYNCLPDWDYVSKFKSGSVNIAVSDSWLCFLPFFRIEEASLSLIDCQYRQGWDGHHEMTWPTILKHSGKIVTDIGGAGPHVAKQNLNQYYLGMPHDGYKKVGSFGTLNIRLMAGGKPNTLWHPVKPFGDWVRQIIKRYRSIFGWAWGRFVRR